MFIIINEENFDKNYNNILLIGKKKIMKTKISDMKTLDNIIMPIVN